MSDDLCRVFQTFEDVNGMRKSMKKQVQIHSKQINEPFQVVSLEGNYKNGKAGDYLMRGIQGELYICDKEIFEQTYDFLE
jgi:hypothetical protein